ncbi:MAG: 3-isopropylmalate dehydratase [Thermodesulfobacteriota bacterium]
MTIFKGKVWKFGDNINTDLMMPGSQFLQPGISEKEAARHCMSANRPGWAEQVEEGDIVIAGHNWGCGSSRPAARMFKALGIGIIVADSMSRLFFRNAVNIGFPVLICPGCSEAFNEGDQANVNMETGEVENLTTNIALQGEALPSDSPPAQIFRAGGLKKLFQKELAEKKV